MQTEGKRAEIEWDVRIEGFCIDYGKIKRMRILINQLGRAIGNKDEVKRNDGEFSYLYRTEQPQK